MIEMVKVLVVIHKGPFDDGLNYDVLIKRNVIDKIWGRGCPSTNGYEYLVDCPVAKAYVKEGWEYCFSGDTYLTKETLKEMGLRDGKDVEGLASYLIRRFNTIVKFVSLLR